MLRNTSFTSNRKYTRPMSPRPNRNPCAASVMKRALILNAIYVTGMMLPSGDLVRSDLARRASDNRYRIWENSGESPSIMVNDLKTAGLWPDVEEDEQKLLLSDRISKQHRIDASWLGESIASLLCALQMIPKLPAYDREADPTLAFRLRSESIPELIRQAELRPKKEIERQRHIAELWHWRARTRELQELGHFNGQFVSGRTIEQIIEQTATKGARSGRLPNPVAFDFPALEMPYRDLSSDEFAILTSISQERHKAFNWLCGYSPTGRWADTRTDT